MTYSVNDGFTYYIQCLGNKDYLQTFSSPDNMNFLQSISEEQSTHRYAADKWSIKQILGHITDHERIMIYRILRFSKKILHSCPVMIRIYLWKTVVLMNCRMNNY